MLICCNRGQFLLIPLSLRAKLLTSDWSIGENILSSLAERASSKFRWFLVSKNNKFFQVLWSSTVKAGLFVPQIHGNQVQQLERKFLNVEFSCLLQEKAKDYFIFLFLVLLTKHYFTSNTILQILR